MRIAIDKTGLELIEPTNEYIYIYDKEPLSELIKRGIHCINYKYVDFMDINATDFDIECLKKTKVTEKDWNKLPEKKDFKIGIIIPNYNYSQCIEKCLTSILNQTYKNYQIIFVDDMSTDDSIVVAEKTFANYLKKELCGFDSINKLSESQFKIVKLKQKRLNGGARNEAYLYLDDDVDYVYYVDSDDWLYSDRALEEINHRLQSEPDVLFVGMASYRRGKLEICFTPNYKDKYEAMLGWSGSCGKVIKKSLATRQECLYNEGTLKEDKNQHCKICIYMSSFALLKKPIYVWNQENSKSVTTVREKVVWGTSTIRHYADTLQLYLSVKGKDRKIDEILKKRVEKTKKEMETGGDKQW